MDSNIRQRLILRAPRRNDGIAVHRLVGASPPLDLNSAYSYFLLCDHFAETCVVAEQDGALAGFISAYRLPRDASRLFVWQVVVDAKARGQGLAGLMLDALLARPACAGVRYVEATVNPDNAASRRVFTRLAAAHQTGLVEEMFLTAADFGDKAHEAEVLLRVGPLLEGNA
ncbi:MAG: diaminobutyrate acetyltransferase [Thiohalomonadaceae bacterium]